MTIRPANPADLPELRRLTRALWGDLSDDDAGARLGDLFVGGTIHHLRAAVYVVDRGDARLGGFIEVSVRPFADHCRSQPVGYIEAWYVDADLRRQAFGRALVDAGEVWVRSLGLVEFASDCVSENVASYLAHRRLGFVAGEPILGFRKPLSADFRAEPVDRIAIVDFNLLSASAIAFVTHPDAGAINLFLGTTRSETHPDGRSLLSLDYEAYMEMATQQFYDLAARARHGWPILKLALLHRVGRVRVGEPSVLIAVSTPHRAEAFESCKFLIDTLKKEVTIWKKEIWSDGTASWVHG